MIERAEVRLQAETERLIAERIDGAVKHRLAEFDRRLGGLQRKAIDAAERRLDETVSNRFGQAERANLERLQVERERIGGELRADLRKQGVEQAGKEQRRLQAALDERLRQMSDAMLVRVEPRLHNRVEEILVEMRADVRGSLDEASAETLRKLSTAANDRLAEIERRGAELRRAAYEGAAVELAERLESRISSHVGALEERFEKAFEERVQRTGKSVLAQIEPKLRDRLEGIRKAIDSELRIASTKASQDLMKQLDRRIAESEKRLTTMSNEHTATLERRGDEAKEKLDRMIGKRITVAETKAREQARSELETEADRLMKTRFTPEAERRLKETELRLIEEGGRRLGEMVDRLAERSGEGLSEDMESLVTKGRAQIEESSAAAHADATAGLDEKIEQLVSEAEQRFARHAERLSREAEERHAIANDRVRAEALKRVRKETAQIRAEGDRARRHSSAQGVARLERETEDVEEDPD